MKQLLCVVACLVAAVPVLAGPPQTGVYTSLSGGPMLDGRFSESWVGPGSHGQLGNTINAMSWDMTTLGTQWKLWCPSIAIAPTLESDNRDSNGTGDVNYSTTYAGGYFWLWMNGPWGDGSQDYTGTISTFQVRTTYEYVFNNVLGIRSNVTLSGQFDGFDNCMDYVINNIAFLGDTNGGSLPAGFPVFYDNSCNTGMVTRGGWGTVTDLTMQIYGSCTVPVDESTWGAVKARYSE